MKKEYINITGPPGSGKTTIAMLVARELKMDYISAGEVFRKEAEARSLSLIEFSRMAERDYTIDRLIDNMVLEKADKCSDAVIDSRLAGILMKRRGITVFTVRIDAEPRVRRERISKRGGESMDPVKREESENKRYMAIYGIDPREKSYYDLIIDSTMVSIDEVYSTVKEAYYEWASMKK